MNQRCASCKYWNRRDLSASDKHAPCIAPVPDSVIGLYIKGMTKPDDGAECRAYVWTIGFERKDKR